MQALLAALIALIALPQSAALRVSPLTTRRHAIVAGASLVPAALVLPRAAHADAIEDIAARNAEANRKAAEQKAKEAEGKQLLLAAEGGLNLVLSAGSVAVLGAAAFFFAGIKGDADKSKTFNLDNARFMTDAEKRKYSNLS